MNFNDLTSLTYHRSEMARFLSAALIATHISISGLNDTPIFLYMNLMHTLTELVECK